MKSFLNGFEDALREIFTTRALLSTLVIAVLFYAFYYPAPYRHQSVVDLPVVVVDEEDSSFTRELIRALDDTREVSVVALAPDANAAEREVRERRAEGIVRLGNGLTRRLLTGSGTGGVSITVNGSYLLRARGIGLAVQRTVQSLAEDRFEPSARVTGAARPLRLEARPLFNPTAGYADYIFPAVSVVILQQTLLFGAAMLAGGRRGRQAKIPGPSAYFGTLAAMTLIGVLACAFYFGLVFWIEDIPRGGNIGGLLVATPIFAMSVAALGLLIGSFLNSGDRAMEILVPTSVVLFFLTGAAWPTEMMPKWVAATAMLSPATHGVPLFVGLNQMAASLPEMADHLVRLSILGLAYVGLTLLRISRFGDGSTPKKKADET